MKMKTYRLYSDRNFVGEIYSGDTESDEFYDDLYEIEERHTLKGKQIDIYEVVNNKNVWFTSHLTVLSEG